MFVLNRRAMKYLRSMPVMNAVGMLLRVASVMLLLRRMSKVRMLKLAKIKFVGLRSQSVLLLMKSMVLLVELEVVVREVS